MASPNVSELLTVTLQNQSTSLADNISTNNAAYYKLKEAGRIKTVAGGYTLREPIMYAANGTGKWYAGYEPLDITPQDVLSAGQFEWKQYAIAVTISGLEQRQNSGSKEQLFDLLESRIEVAKISATNAMDAGFFSDGTANGGKQLGGLQSLFSATPAVGTVGGINAANYTFWRNVARATSTSLGQARSAANIKQELDAVYNQIVRGSDKPDLALMDNADFGYLQQALQAIQQISGSKMAEAGFESVKYRGMDCVLAGGFGGNIPASTIPILNTKYLSLKVHKDCNMSPLDPQNRYSINQDAVVKLIAWMGNLTLSNRSLQGWLTA